MRSRALLRTHIGNAHGRVVGSDRLNQRSQNLITLRAGEICLIQRLCDLNLSNRFLLSQFHSAFLNNIQISEHLYSR